MRPPDHPAAPQSLGQPGRTFDAPAESILTFGRRFFSRGRPMVAAGRFDA